MIPVEEPPPPPPSQDENKPEIEGAFRDLILLIENYHHGLFTRQELINRLIEFFILLGIEIDV